MKLIEVTESDRQVYNRFVIEHNGSFLQSWEWGEWQVRLGRTVYRFMIKDDNGEQTAAMQLVKMPIGFGRFYLYAPYGPVSAAGEQVQISHPAGDHPKGGNFKSILSELTLKFPNCVFVRIEPQNINLTLALSSGGEGMLQKSTNIQPAVTLIVDLEKSEEGLLADMHPKTRYNIKVAQRHGVVVESELPAASTHLAVQDVISLISDTQKRQKYRGHSENYYYQLLNFFLQHSPEGDMKLRIYRAKHNQELLACGVMVDFGKIRIYLYGGSSDNNKNFMAPYLLHWQAMLDAKNLKLLWYDLGGSEAASRGEQGFTRFKQGFRGTLVSYAGAYDLPFNRIIYKFYVILRAVNRIFRK